MEGSSSRRPLRRKTDTDDFPSEATTSKRRKLNADLQLNEKIDLSVENIGSPPKNIISADDLPPEIIEAILKYSSTKDLFNFRLVNYKWNELSSRILRHRADTVLRFRFVRGHFMNCVIKTCIILGPHLQCNTKSLKDFIDCFQRAKHFPYSYFDISDLDDFGNDDLNTFLSIWGKNILSLKVTIIDPIKSIEMLRKLLFEQIPNLKELEIRFSRDMYEVNSTIQLFSDSKQIQLPKLEVLVVDKRYRKWHRIIENILTAACNLKEFQSCYSNSKSDFDTTGVRDSLTTEDVKMFLAVNKLHCLKKIEIRLSEDFIIYWGQHSKRMDLKLEYLRVEFDDIFDNQKLTLEATSIMNQLLKSSKNVIETLAIQPIGLLPGVVIPKLTNLHKLVFLSPNRQWGHPRVTKRAMFPPLIEMAEVFPNVTELDLHLAYDEVYFPPSTPLIPMPSIEALRLFKDSSPEVREKLMKMTPNVKTLFVTSDAVWNNDSGDRNIREAFINGFRVILSNLKKLENMKWHFNGLTHRELLFSLDAAVTGLPEEFCKKLSEKFRNKNHLSANGLTSIQSQRKHSSILDLKDLKNLDIHFDFDGDAYACFSESECEESDCEGMCKMGNSRNSSKDDEAGFTGISKFYQTGFTKVSKFLCFDLMPNLDISIRKD